MKAVYASAIIYLTGTVCCTSAQSDRPIDFSWTQLTQLPQAPAYCYSDSLSGEIVVACSWGLGLNGSSIRRVGPLGSASKSEELLSVNASSLYSFSSQGDMSGCILFEKCPDGSVAALCSKAIIRKSLGEPWMPLETPSNWLRSFAFVGSLIIVEGQVGGSNHLYWTADTGRTWTEINYMKHHLKYLQFVSTNGSAVFCLGSEEYVPKSFQLIRIEPLTSVWTTVAEVPSSSCFATVTSSGEAFGVQDDDEAVVYRIGPESSSTYLDLPDGIGEVRCLFMNQQFVVVTGYARSMGKVLSWVKHNSSIVWSSLGHEEELQLVDNSFGALLMLDKHQRILQGKLAH